LRAWQGRAAGDVVFADSDSSREIAPKLRVRASGIFFLGKIFQYGLAERAFRASRQDAKMLGKGFDVAVILGGVELQSLAAELARLPVLVKRVLQEIFLGDCGIQPSKKFGIGHRDLRRRGRRKPA